MSAHFLDDKWVNNVLYRALILLLDTEVGLKSSVPLMKPQKRSKVTKFRSSIWESAGNFP
jgi:hypothetical protein